MPKRIPPCPKCVGFADVCVFDLGGRFVDWSACANFHLDEMFRAGSGWAELPKLILLVITKLCATSN